MEQAKTTAARRWGRIIPVAFLMYTIAFMDRINIGLAIPSMARAWSSWAWARSPAEAAAAAPRTRTVMG